MSKKCFVLGLTFLFWFSISEAYDATPRCFKAIETSFFQKKTVLLALTYYSHDFAQWDPISRAFLDRNRDMPALIRERAKKWRPNPFDNPFNNEGAITILKDVARELTFDVLSRHPGVDRRDWESLFNFIFDSEMERIQKCLK